MSYEVELLIQYSHASRCDETQIWCGTWVKLHNITNVCFFFGFICLFHFISLFFNELWEWAVERSLWLWVLELASFQLVAPFCKLHAECIAARSLLCLRAMDFNTTVSTGQHLKTTMFLIALVNPNLMVQGKAPATASWKHCQPPWWKTFNKPTCSQNWNSWKLSRPGQVQSWVCGTEFVLTLNFICLYVATIHIRG